MKTVKIGIFVKHPPFPKPSPRNDLRQIRKVRGGVKIVTFPSLAAHRRPPGILRSIGSPSPSQLACGTQGIRSTARARPRPVVPVVRPTSVPKVPVVRLPNPSQSTTGRTTFSFRIGQGIGTTGITLITGVIHPTPRYNRNHRHNWTGQPSQPSSIDTTGCND